jgi:hypothetical protein
MKAIWLYRTAAIIFVLFAAGHTFGFLSFKAATPEGRAVFDAMNRVHFTQRSGTYSYGNFYRGFGLSCSVSMLLSAYLSWHLGQLSRALPQAIGALGWVFCAAQVAGLVITVHYFGVTQASFAGVLIVALGWAAWLTTADSRSDAN